MIVYDIDKTKIAQIYDMKVKFLSKNKNSIFLAKVFSWIFKGGE